MMSICLTRFPNCLVLGEPNIYHDLGNLKVGNEMVKERKLTLMEVSILGNGEMEICGTKHHTTKMETS